LAARVGGEREDKCCTREHDDEQRDRPTTASSEVLGDH
jgi:hypothetical protein